MFVRLKAIIIIIIIMIIMIIIMIIIIITTNHHHHHFRIYPQVKIKIGRAIVRRRDEVEAEPSRETQETLRRRAAFAAVIEELDDLTSDVDDE